MAVLRYNNVHTRLAAAIDDNDTTITLEAALTEGGVNVPTLAGDTILLGIDDEVLELTAYTAGATSGTVTRGYGDTLEAAHDTGAVVANVVTKDDVGRPTEGPKAYRYTDAGSPVSLTANIDTALTEAFLDGEDYADTGIAWNNTTDGYDLDDAGLYEITGYADLDSSAISTGHVYLKFAGPPVISPQTPDIPFGSGVDMTLHLTVTMWLDAGSLLQMRLRSTEAVDVTYAELHVRRVLAG